MGNGCYAEGGPLGQLWRGMSEAGPNASFPHGKASVRTTDWKGLCSNVAALPADTVWRHNQAGDLPNTGGMLSDTLMSDLIAANHGKRGFTYTHHNVLQSEHNRNVVECANRNGFTINLSGNNLAHADALADLGIAPVVAVLPASVEGKADIATPKGRKVVVCPATYKDDVSCLTCKLCSIRDRKVIVGFPAHGASKARASKIGEQTT